MMLDELCMGLCMYIYVEFVFFSVNINTLFIV